MTAGNIFHGALRWPFAEDDAPLETPAQRWGVATAHDRILLCGSGSVRGGAVSGYRRAQRRDGGARGLRRQAQSAVDQVGEAVQHTRQSELVGVRSAVGRVERLTGRRPDPRGQRIPVTVEDTLQQWAGPFPPLPVTLAAVGSGPARIDGNPGNRVDEAQHIRQGAESMSRSLRPRASNALELVVVLGHHARAQRRTGGGQVGEPGVRRRTSRGCPRRSTETFSRHGFPAIVASRHLRGKRYRPSGPAVRPCPAHRCRWPSASRPSCTATARIVSASRPSASAIRMAASTTASTVVRCLGLAGCGALTGLAPEQFERAYRITGTAAVPSCAFSTRHHPLCTMYSVCRTE